MLLTDMVALATKVEAQPAYDVRLDHEIVQRLGITGNDARRRVTRSFEQAVWLVNWARPGLFWWCAGGGEKGDFTANVADDMGDHGIEASAQGAWPASALVAATLQYLAQKMQDTPAASPGSRTEPTNHGA